MPSVSIVDRLPLAMALKHQPNYIGACFIYPVIEEDAKHRFITCQLANAIEDVLSPLGFCSRS